MKTIFKYFIYTTLLTGLLSCKKDDIPRTPDFSKFKPEATPKGTPAGTVYAQQIGPAGGQVRSADGLLTLDIPAGALSANTNIGIQPITNNAPLGAGPGYRLTPEGTTFAKPVKISFKYNDQILDGGLPDFLWIATQKEDGTWLGDRRSTVDKNTKTVSTETTHFSDWVTGRFINLALVPDKKTIRVGESVELELTGFLSKDEWGDDLVPLAHVSSGSDDLVPVDRFAVAKEYHAFDIGEWTLNGSKVPVNNANGSLDSYYDGLHAEYKAPAKVPSTRTVAVSLSLSFNKTTGGKSTVMLVSNITIVEDEYYAITTIGGREVNYYDGMEYTYSGKQRPKDKGQAGVLLTGNELNLIFTSPTPDFSSLNIRLKGPKKGINGTCVNESAYQVAYTDNKSGFTQYLNAYRDQKWNSVTSLCEGRTKCSEINVTLTEYTGEKGSAVAGKFSGIVYHVPVGTNCPAPVPLAISGEFRLLLPK